MNNRITASSAIYHRRPHTLPTTQLPSPKEHHLHYAVDPTHNGHRKYYVGSETPYHMYFPISIKSALPASCRKESIFHELRSVSSTIMVETRHMGTELTKSMTKK